jgi:hypothetical protein
MRAGKILLLFLSIAAFGADKKAVFRPEPIETYDSRQTVQGLTIAAVPFDDPEEAQSAFGKINPYEHGVLPVLVVMKNVSEKTLELNSMQTLYIAPRNRKVDATPAQDVMYLKGAGSARVANSRLPGGGPTIRTAKNPLKNEIIIERAFSARMLPPGETAWGFLYFQTGHTRGNTLYVSGIREAQTAKELFFFEVPLN